MYSTESKPRVRGRGPSETPIHGGHVKRFLYKLDARDADTEFEENQAAGTKFNF